MNSLRTTALCASLLIASGAAQAANTKAGDFPLRDFLGRNWQNERVTFPLTGAQLKHAKAGLALLGPDQKAVPYQVLPADKAAKARIVFLADLKPFEARAYTFGEAPAKMESDLKVEEAGDVVVLSNSRTGIRLPKALKNGQGPFDGVRLPSGVWAGGSSMTNDQAMTAYTVEVLSHGPVSAEALCKAVFADSTIWQARVRLDANEPVVLVDEQFDVAGKANLRLDFSRNFNPDMLLYRPGKEPLGRNAVWKLAQGEAFILEPWLLWQQNERRGNSCNFYRADGADLLSFAEREAGAWVDPKLSAEKAVSCRQVVKQDEQGVHVDFPIRTGARKWMFTALDKAAAMPKLVDASPASMETALPYQYLIKHGHFPLDMVKDEILTWKNAGESYPHMLASKADVAHFKNSVTNLAAYSNSIPYYLANYKELTPFNTEAPIKAFFATDNPELGKLLGQATLRMMQETADLYTIQLGEPLGAAPHHHQQVGVVMLLADAALAGNGLTPDERERLLAQAAFLGYTMNSASYWSPERGFCANPNMTTSVYGYQATIACLLSSHPMARQWVKKSMDDLKTMLDTWSDEGGGWLEAPHYAMVAYDQILGAFVMAKNSGLNDYLYSDPKVKTVINWFSKISTPPDSRIQGHRHLPPAGNTYLQEASGEFGLLAFLFKDKDPAFAAQMEWMFKQHWSWPYPGCGGFYPAFSGCRSLMLDPNLPEQAPVWKSELFPETGAVLRNGYPSERETYLHMIQGSHHAHYDNDSGSVILWGKGRIIADDFGYYVPDVEDHNLVQGPQCNAGMRVLDFERGDDVDYLRGVSGAWTRQVMLVKSADPLGANYFVFCDSFKAPMPAVWRLHVLADKVTLGKGEARVAGKEDVDTDIFFLQPSNLELKTETKDRHSNSGIFPDGRSSGAVPMTQIAIVATAQPRYDNLTALIYPRLKTETTPKVTSIAGGKGMIITHAAGVDYIFLGPAPFSYQDKDVTFSGMNGAVLIRNGKAVLSVGAGGSITYRGQSLKSGKPLPIPPETGNLVENGDFESGQQSVFVPNQPDNRTTISLYKGNPVAGDQSHKGQYCVATKLAGSSGVAGFAQPCVVDPSKKYRISLNAFTPDAICATIAGYGWNSQGGQIANWQWDMPQPKGPMTAWKGLAVTVGPKGSGATCTWPDDIVMTSLCMWISGGPGVIYVDDVSIAEAAKI